MNMDTNEIASNGVEMPTRPHDYRRAIGTILVEEGHLNTRDVDPVCRYAAEKGLRFGEAAVQLKLVSQDDIDLAVAQQFNYPILLRGGINGVAENDIAAYNPQSDLVEPLRVLR